MSLNDQQIGRPRVELDVEDLLLAQKVMGKLKELAGLDNMKSVEIRFSAGGDEITVGYGPSGNPAILRIDPA